MFTDCFFEFFYLKVFVLRWIEYIVSGNVPVTQLCSKITEVFPRCLRTLKGWISPTMLPQSHLFPACLWCLWKEKEKWKNPLTNITWRQKTSDQSFLTSCGLSECARCGKWGPHFQFMRFEGAPFLIYALSKMYEIFFMIVLLL